MSNEFDEIAIREEALTILVNHYKKLLGRAREQMSIDKDMFFLLTDVIKHVCPRSCAIDTIENIIRTAPHDYNHQTITEIREWYKNEINWV